MSVLTLTPSSGGDFLEHFNIRLHSPGGILTQSLGAAWAVFLREFMRALMIILFFSACVVTCAAIEQEIVREVNKSKVMGK